MQNCSQRLAKAVRMMELLEARRRTADDPNLGSNIERLIVARELRDLEQEIVHNPGALAAQYALSVRRPGRSVS